MTRPKALALLSGGLDSTLAAKMMMEQGVEVIGLNFTSPFCGACQAKDGKESKIQVTARQLGIPIRYVPLREDYVDVIRHPKYGYGQGVNPCIDCRIYTMKIAKEIMAEEGADFMISGEVLGQRPMSQRRDAMEVIDRDAGIEGIMLRPLSAKSMPPTKAEEEGRVDREAMGNITGRSRQGQFELAEKLEIHEYPSPAGGCLLTDKIFAVRLRDLFDRREDVGFRDIHVLQLGRIVRLTDKTRAIIGRKESENDALSAYQDRGDAFLEPDNFAGPSALICGPHSDAERVDVGAMMAYWGKAPESGPHRVIWFKNGVREGIFEVSAPFPEAELRSRMI